MRTTSEPRRGGAWLLAAPALEPLVCPERLNEEHLLIGRTAQELVDAEILPAVARLEEKDWPLTRRLLRQCGELGLLGVDVPEAYGGVELDKVSSIIVAERVSRYASFAAAFGGQTNLTILPLLCFGSDDQRARYLPGLVAGELIGAYALSEAGAGSDALGIKTRATRDPSGDFVLNGEKMWITNGGFADLFVVFAKVDAEQFTAFIVERGFPGVSTGKEEHKLGLRGSSTTPLILQDARVPAANVLGEIGKGHKVAFNVLNYGRLKLGAMCLGGARNGLAESSRYAAERRQFGRPIGDFGAIKQKLGEMSARAYATESMLYRTAGAVDAAIGGARQDGRAVLAALEEFAVEASIIKVAASEMLDYVADQNVQIHGGNGFVTDYAAERHFRDARVNRIFEGTNEINRLLIPTLLIRRGLKGDLGLFEAGKTGAAASDGAADGARQETARVLRHCKAAAVAALRLIGRTYGEDAGAEQELLGLAADLVVDAFAVESAWLRASGAAAAAHPLAPLHADAARVIAAGASARALAAGTEFLGHPALAPDAADLESILRQLLEAPVTGTIEARRRLADAAMDRGGYFFS